QRHRLGRLLGQQEVDDGPERRVLGGGAGGEVETAAGAPAVDRLDGEQVGRRLGRLGRGRRQLAQRRQVVQDPDRPAHRAYHQVVLLHLQVVDGGGGEVQLQRLPGGAVVGRVGDAALGAEV